MKNKIILLIATVFIIAESLYILAITFFPNLTPDMGAVVEKARSLLAKGMEGKKAVVERARSLLPKTPEENASANSVTLYLKNKAVISGDLVRTGPDEIVIRWRGGEVGFKQDEIERIEYGEIVEDEGELLFPEEKEKWPYQNDVVIQLKNLVVLDAGIVDVTPDTVIIQYPLEGGGSIEQEIERGKIEYLLFRPIEGGLSEHIGKNLREQFSKMRFHREGLFTIVTDSSNVWLKKYSGVLRQHLTDFYLTYFRLLKDRKPARQSFVVIFDSFKGYADYALTDGVPGWLVAGYFSPIDKVLYMPNSLGTEVEDMIHEVILAKIRQNVKEIEDWIKGQVDKRYHIFIEGMADEYKGKYVKIYDVIQSHLRMKTYRVLRHEATHELFHNWGLQSIIMSKTKISPEDMAKKKKEYLETDDIEKKRELLSKLWSQKKGQAESYEAEAANSWFSEGTATHSETSPLGEVNEDWLYVFQKARRENALLPIEQLTVYKMGSFPGMATEPMYAAYGESWAFTYFLMNNYRVQFMNYLERIAAKKPEGNEDLLWLLEALGKDLRGLEEEFLAYMEQFEEVEMPDFDVKLNILVYETFYGR